MKIIDSKIWSSRMKEIIACSVSPATAQILAKHSNTLTSNFKTWAGHTCLVCMTGETNNLKGS
jgi:hypothetical protein